MDQSLKARSRSFREGDGVGLALFEGEVVGEREAPAEMDDEERSGRMLSFVISCENLQFFPKGHLSPLRINLQGRFGPNLLE